MMKSRILASLLLAGFPWLVMAQSNDDLISFRKEDGSEEGSRRSG